MAAARSSGMRQRLGQGGHVAGAPAPLSADDGGEVNRDAAGSSATLAVRLAALPLPVRMTAARPSGVRPVALLLPARTTMARPTVMHRWQRGASRDAAGGPAPPSADYGGEAKQDGLAARRWRGAADGPAPSGADDDNEVDQDVVAAARSITDEARRLLHELAAEWGDDVADRSAVDVVSLKGAMTNEVYQARWPPAAEAVEGEGRRVVMGCMGEGMEVFFDREAKVCMFESMSWARGTPWPSPPWPFPEQTRQGVHSGSPAPPGTDDGGEVEPDGQRQRRDGCVGGSGATAANSGAEVGRAFYLNLPTPSPSPPRAAALADDDEMDWGSTCSHRQIAGEVNGNGNGDGNDQLASSKHRRIGTGFAAGLYCYCEDGQRSP
uniref:Uncharacterized protein n=1 Tax=Leersia perrieri TaxID=77586 RepID=A0A0D9XIL8_9ORYZ